MAGIKIVDLPALGRDLASTDLLELSLAGGTGSRKITGQEIMNASKLSINNTPIINGTVGRVLFQGTGDVLQQSSSLFWDATNNRLGIGTSSPFGSFDVRDGDIFSTISSNANLRSRLTYQGLYVSRSTDGTYTENIISTSSAWLYSSRNSHSFFRDGVAILQLGTTAFASYATINTTGNVLINTTTDAGFKLDINGTARVSGRFTIGSDIIPSGVGSSVVLAAHVAAGNILDLSYYTGSQTALSTTKNVVYSAITFNPTGGTAVFNQLNFAPTINQTGGANGITRGLYVNPTLTAAADFRAIETTAGNVIFNGGNVGIGTSSPTQSLSIQTGAIFGNTSFGGGLVTTFDGTSISMVRGGCTTTISSGFGGVASIGTVSNAPFRIFTSNSSRIQIGDNGNVQINTTTDAGYRLDVNGTARVQGNVTFGSTSTTGVATIQGSNVVELYLTDTLNGRNFRLYKNAGSGYIIENNSSNKMSYGYSGNYFMSWHCNSKSIAISSSASEPNPDATAVLDIQSTTKGFLPPRMTQAERNAIASPAIGLEIYQTDATEGKYIYKSSGWTYIG